MKNSINMFNLEDRCYPLAITIDKLFEKQAELYPNKSAIICDSQAVTYKQLNNSVNYYAKLLLNSDIKQGNLIGVCLERGVPSIIAMLAILKLGCAFLLIDPNLPLERIKYILRNSQIDLLLVNNMTDSKINTNDHPYINIENWKSSESTIVTNLNVLVNTNDLAYVMYTSGTTGMPKGILIEHRGLLNTILEQLDIFGITASDNFLITSPVSFDAFLMETFLCLASGATGYLTTNQEKVSIKKLSSIITKNYLSVVIMTPSLLRLFTNDTLASLRLIISIGELCTKDVVNKSTDTCTFFNAYGPTEASIITTINKCAKQDERILIGKPIKNVSTYVLNEYMSQVNVGEIGTLYIGGIGLARGYLNDPELTQQKFISNPFNDPLSDRLYNSGDLVRLHENGALEYIGRKDDEVKINGQRTNLNEIKRVLHSHPSIRNCLVKAVDHPKHLRKKIVAIIETNDGSLSSKDVKNYLLQYLPSYMIPYQIVKTKHIPLSHSGKTSDNTPMLETDKI